MENDLKELIFERDNDTLRKDFDIHIEKKVSKFIESKKEEKDLAMVLTKMNKKHDHFSDDFEVFFMSMLYKILIIILQNN